MLLRLARVKGGKRGVLQGGEHRDGRGEDRHPGEGRCQQRLGKRGAGADGGVRGHDHLPGPPGWQLAHLGSGDLTNSCLFSSAAT